MDTDLRDRARGLMVGLAIGDALGAYVQNAVAGDHDEQPPLATLFPRGAHTTDDTALACCLARSLVTVGHYDPQDALGRYAYWQSEQGDDDTYVGSVSTVLHAIKAMGPSAQVLAESYHEATNGLSSGNGALARVAPLAIRYRGDDWDLARVSRLDAQLTHHDPQVALDSISFSRLLVQQLTLGSQAAAAAPPSAADPHGSDDAGRRNLALQGTSSATLRLAQWALARSSDDGQPHRILEEIVRLGGDADTNGAVAGAALGARHGLEAFPAEWVTAVDPDEHLAELADRVLTA